jgi:hypothetical protein
MILSPTDWVLISLLIVSVLLWLILRTYEGQTARRARLFAGIAALVVAYELLWVHSANIIFSYVRVWLILPVVSPMACRRRHFVVAYSSRTAS